MSSCSLHVLNEIIRFFSKMSACLSASFFLFKLYLVFLSLSEEN
uniref:Uncharacterized protein n=1 Tax=Nelumbo nucifera TaxID=4432 RepID=A0A822Y0B0_NELNU|nr:TPA_asm: hypothetical protein HUJ06_027365 [Nelumbo nucifera]